MKKSFILLSIIALGLFAYTTTQAQNIGVVDISGTCKNWANDIYKIVTEEGSPTDSVIIKSEEGPEKVIWTKNTLVIKGVTFYLDSQIFEKANENYTPDCAYFDALHSVWSGIYRKYKKGIYSPDFKD